MPSDKTWTVALDDGHGNATYRRFTREGDAVAEWVAAMYPTPEYVAARIRAWYERRTASVPAMSRYGEHPHRGSVHLMEHGDARGH